MQLFLSALVLAIGLVLSPAVKSEPIIYGASTLGPAQPSFLYSISPATGAATPIGAIGFDGVSAIDFGPDGRLYGVGFFAGTSQPALVVIDPATGAGTAVGSVALAGRTADISFRHSDGLLFASSRSGLSSINVTTLAVNTIGALPAGGGMGLEFDASDTLYLDSGSILYVLNQTTAAVALVVSSPVINAMDMDEATGIIWAVTRFGAEVGTLNLTTGVFTSVGAPSLAGSQRLDAIAIANRVPEPKTILLMVMALLCLLAIRAQRGGATPDLVAAHCPRLRLPELGKRTGQSRFPTARTQPSDFSK